MSQPHFLSPPWTGRHGIEVYSTTRVGGCSQEPYDSLNLGLHVNDNKDDVEANRASLQKVLKFKQKPLWLNQVHGDEIVLAEDHVPALTVKHPSSARKQAPILAPTADGAWTRQRHLPLAVLTADCLPVVLATGAHNAYAIDPKSIAVVHAGWRGLAGGIVERAVETLDARPGSIAAWLGPAIGAQQFEVGDEVRDAFAAAVPGSEIGCFKPSDRVHPEDGGQAKTRWMCDLYRLARQILTSRGVTEISGGNHCTFNDQDLFYSFRRDGAGSGRMATVAIIRDN